MFESFSQYFDPKRNQSWIPVAKVGGVFVGIGLLILLLKELIIAILAAISIGIGVFILTVAFRIWRMLK
ncbi:MAG: hypothetical protein ISR90_05660 [Candidatus Marinimicrobia bacterium]|nr:hypothetical protein [Candidatus Neomarinimicrobiota bacterium]MBL7023519.1 hypothetical protein [Candidatus Neomarinimicrobiota bacterium]MBL7109421.1 hypothetical protein [Candidatus Neomarinimicrobiota bacterium]